MSTPNTFEIRDQFNDLLQVGRQGESVTIAVTLNPDGEHLPAGIILDRGQALRVAELLTPFGSLAEGARTVEDKYGNVLEVRIVNANVGFTIWPAKEDLDHDYEVLISREEAFGAYELLTR